EVLVDLASMLSGDFLLTELSLGNKYARKPPALPSPCPACSLPAPPSRSDLWPREWPMPPVRPPEPDPPKPPERAAYAFRVGGGLWADMISTVRGSFGLTLDLGARFGWFSVAGEVGGDPSLGKTQIPTGGSFGFARITGALLLCTHVGWFVSC